MSFHPPVFPPCLPQRIKSLTIPSHSSLLYLQMLTLHSTKILHAHYTTQNPLHLTVSIQYRITALTRMEKTFEVIKCNQRPSALKDAFVQSIFSFLLNKRTSFLTANTPLSLGMPEKGLCSLQREEDLDPVCFVTGPTICSDTRRLCYEEKVVTEDLLLTASTPRVGCSSQRSRKDHFRNFYLLYFLFCWPHQYL